MRMQVREIIYHGSNIVHNGRLIVDADRQLTSLKTVQGNTTIRNMNFVFDASTGNLLNPRGRSIEYNALNKATILIDTVDNDTYRLEIIYGPDGQRWKTVLQKNSSVIKTVIFAGDYEKITEDGVTKELIYLPGGGIYVRQAGQPDKVYYTHTDHLGSIVSITDGAGAEVFKASYDAWGKQIITNNTFKFHRGYTGHEHLPEFGLINMNGRMYDPVVGRFLSPDPFVQAPEFSQSFNRYSYALNNPLIYTDPSGEIACLIPALIVIGKSMLVGAAVGATVGGATYAISAGISGNWNNGDFWKSVGFGAVGGAIGGTFSGLGTVGAFGQFGNSFAYSMLSQTSSSLITNSIYGNNITWGSVAGNIAGSFISAGMPAFKGVNGGWLKNAFAEVGASMAKGAYVGAFSGAVRGIIDNDPNAMIQGMVGGAISGGSGALLRIGTMGPTFIPDENYYCDIEDFGQIHRTGALLRGIAIGNNAVGLESRSKYSFDKIRETRHHEGYHVKQMNEMGAFGFYSRTLSEYLGAILRWGDFNTVYHQRGTLEKYTRTYTWGRLGYFFYGDEIRHNSFF